MSELIRCPWAGSDPLYIAYHDNEWGKPVHDDRLLFEFLILEGAQAGLSWITILKKRENYRKAFDNFDPILISEYNDEKIAQLLANAGIIRNRLKIGAAVTNARAFLKIQQQYGSFDSYMWGFVDGKPIRNAWETVKDVPASTPLSDKFSRDLVQRGFKFVGSTICYSHMQAIGMINDHITSCFRYDEV